jgi:hypothetical protein
VALGLTPTEGTGNWHVEVHPSAGWQALLSGAPAEDPTSASFADVAVGANAEKTMTVRLRLGDSTALLDDGYAGLLIRLTSDDMKVDAWQKLIYFYTAGGKPEIVSISEYLASLNTGTLEAPVVNGPGLFYEAQALAVSELTDPQLRQEYNKIATAVPRARSQRAVTHYVYGALKFWDARPNRSAQGATGSRFKYCNIKDLTCSPNDADCCWTFIPQARVNLHVDCPGCDIVSSYQMTQYGGFVLSDPNWVAGREYWISVDSEHIGYPVQIKMTAVSGGIYFRFLDIANFTMPNTGNFIGEVSINAAHDYTSGTGHYLTDWTSYQEAAEWISADGETRFRKNYGSQNSYDTIEIIAYNASPSVDCSNSRITSALASVRTQQPMRDFGRVLHGRVVGCNWTAPSFPPFDNGFSGVQDGAEGPAVYYAIPELIYTLSMRDPNTAPTPSNYLTGLPGMGCWDNSFLYNSNDAVSYTNTANALWDFIDTSTSGSDDGYTDSVNLNLANLMTALQNWKAYLPGNPGLNRSANEWYMNEVNFYCNTNYDCGAGDVCNPRTGKCWTGDPHGGNVRDWAYHIGLQAGLSDTTMWETLASCPCILPADNSYPFTGGYRAD